MYFDTCTELHVINTNFEIKSIFFFIKYDIVLIKKNTQQYFKIVFSIDKFRTLLILN